MYDSAELPFHPDHLGGSSSDSAYEAAPVICGLCAKGPKATEAWRNNGKYCFSDGKVKQNSQLDRCYSCYTL